MRVQSKLLVVCILLPAVTNSNGLSNSNSRNHNINRRNFIDRTFILSTFTGVLAPSLARADYDSSLTTTSFLFRGQVTLSNKASLPPTNNDIDLSNCALYVTARPNTPDNVPVAILNGTRGKSPPVLAARFANVQSFPFEFELTADNLTEEGAANIIENSNGSSKFWWRNDDLIVSARWDSDGVASTRSPDDLVGRGLYISTESAGANCVNIELQGRGATGKFLTGMKQ